MPRRIALLVLVAFAVVAPSRLGGTFPVAAAEATTNVLISKGDNVDPARILALATHVGGSRVETLEMTGAEVWSIPIDRIPAAKKEASALGLRLATLDTNAIQVIRPMDSNPHMSESQAAMMHGIMNQPPVMDMTLLSLGDPAILEYALTRDPANPNSRPLLLAVSNSLTVRALRVSLEKHDRHYVWHGTTQDTSELVTLLWWPKGRLSGSITYKGHVYSIRSLGGGMHGAVELAPNMLPPEHAPLDPALKEKMRMERDPLVERGDAQMLREKTPMESKKAKSKTQDLEDAGGESLKTARIEPGRTVLEPGPNREAATPVTISLLVAYTRGAKAYYDDIEAELIEVAVEDANQSFRTSGLGHIRLELAHSYQTDYVENGTHFDHVFRFADKGDGSMDEVHGMRDQHHGDVAVLIVADPAGCGLAAQVRAPAERAFAVVDQGCAASSYSLAHEIGHLIGARHDAALDDSTTPFPYGHGYVNGRKWRTMMSYKDSCGGCPRIPVWSSSRNLVNGDPAGDEFSDNARVISEEAPRVAAFR